MVVQSVRIYETQANDYLRHWGHRAYRPPALLSGWLRGVPRGGWILDLGCGPGQDARELRRKGYRAVGLDRTRPLLRYASRRSPRVPLVLADLRATPFRAGTLDGIWAAASLIHLPKPAVRRTLRHLRGLVQPGGTLAVTFIHGRHSGIVSKGWLPGRFISRWHKDELEQAVRRAGWEVVALATVANRERKGRWLNLIARRRTAD